MKLCLIIGAMKSGTTTLYDYLRMHPEICASEVKEPSFFTKPSPSSVQIAAYNTLFAGITPGSWACEASTNYTKHPVFPGVSQRIKAMYPDTRLIYILRHPVERIYSHYIHNLTQGRECRNFKDAVLGEDSHYLNVSRYYLQLSQYLDFFPSEHILVLTFEDFIQHSRETLQRVFSFLNIDLSVIPDNLHAKRNVTANKAVMHPLGRKLRALPFYNHLPRPFYALMLRLFQQPAPHKSVFFHPIVHADIVERLSEDVNRLQTYLGTQISAWNFGQEIDYGH